MSLGFVRWSLFLVGAIAAAFLTAAGDGPPPVRTPEDWVKQLGNASYRKREEATRELLQREDAFEALQRARDASDPEVRRRATLILGTLRDRVQEHAAWQLLSAVRPGQVERLITRLTAGKGAADAKDWQELVRLVETLAAQVSRIRGVPFTVLGRGLDKLEVVHDCPAAGLWGKRLAVAGIDHDVETVNHCLLVSAGPVKRLSRVHNSVLLINGDLAGCSSVNGSLIVCRGDLGDVASIDGSVLLIKGRLGQVVCAEDSLFQAHELKRFTTSRHNVFLNHTEVLASFPEHNRYLNAEKK